MISGREVVVLSGTRTAIGDYGGALIIDRKSVV